MQELKRLDDLLERDSQRLDNERRPDRQSDFQKQIDATSDEIRQAFERTSDERKSIRAKVTDNA